jgi:hypothetical protein
MKRLIVLFVIVLVAFGWTIQAQKTTLTFTAQLQDGSYIPLDSIQIKNQTQSWSETLIYPDTVLEIGTVGIVDLENKKFGFSSIIPNPFKGHTNVSLYLPENEHITLIIYDINGKEYISRSLYLEKGEHHFRITTVVPQIYLLQALTVHGNKTIKLQNQGQGVGYDIEHGGILANKTQNAFTAKPFIPNDDMLYIGYRTKDNAVDTVQIRVRQAGVNTNYSFTFRMGWKVGDIYYSNGKAEGLVWWIADTAVTIEGIPYGEHGKLIALTEPFDNEVLWGPATREVRVPAYDTVDGISNTAIIKHYRDTSTHILVWRFQAVTWCVDSLGSEEWYLPAINELRALFAVVVPVLNPVLINTPNAVKITTSPNVSYWSSTTDENNNNNAYQMRWLLYPDLSDIPDYVSTSTKQNGANSHVRAMKLF